MIPDLVTQIVIPACAVVGIVFSLVQWFIVAKVKVSSERHVNNGGSAKNGYHEYLIEEEDGVNDQNVVAKCAEIQNAISEGDKTFSLISDLNV